MCRNETSGSHVEHYNGLLRCDSIVCLKRRTLKMEIKASSEAFLTFNQSIRDIPDDSKRYYIHRCCNEEVYS